jgi:DNA polymerase-3 subunit epsilon
MPVPFLAFKYLEIARPLAFLDLETTGLDPAEDRIVEWTVLRFGPQGGHHLVTRRCNPGVPISLGASAVHGITDADVADHPSFADRLPELVELLSGADISGFGIAGFDLTMLDAELVRAGILPAYRPQRRILDVMVLYHAIAPYSRTARRTLARAVATYAGRSHEGAHRSAADALAAAEVLDGIIAAEFASPMHFDALCQRHGTVPPGTPLVDSAPGGGGGN